jgi:hypothetical protein
MRDLWVEFKTILASQGVGVSSATKFEEYTKQRKLKNRAIANKKLARQAQLVDRLNASAVDSVANQTPAGARELWAQVRRLTRTQNGIRIPAIKDRDDTLQHTASGKATALGQFYSSLADVNRYEQDETFAAHADFHAEVRDTVAQYPTLSLAPEEQGWDCLGGAFSTDEVACVLKGLAHRKAGSPTSRLANELLKYSGAEGYSMLTSLVNFMWSQECKPDFMKVGYIVSVHKKGEPTDPGNFRPLSMLHSIGKVFSKLINNRVMLACEEHGLLHDAQNGFRNGRRCEDHLLTLRQTLAGRLKEGQSTFLYGTDVYKAYDTVWRDGLFFRLWQSGIRGKMWRMLRNMYNNTRSISTFDGQQSTEGAFQVNMGLAQGDPLSPTLFAIFINPLIDAIAARCEGVPLGGSGLTLHSLLFADDQLGMGGSAEAINGVIDAVDAHSARWKVKLNKAKCWVMVVGPQEAEYSEASHWNNSAIPLVSKATYLGGTLDSRLLRDTHAHSLIARAQVKVNMLSKFLSNRRVHAGLRQLVLDTLVKPTLEWGTSVWPPTKTVADKMQALYSEAQRKIVGIHSSTSAAILAIELGSRPLVSWQLQHQLHYCKHLFDMAPERLTKLAAHASWNAAPQGPKPTMWTQTQAKVLKDLQTTTDIFCAGNPTDSSEPHPPSFRTKAKECIMAHDARYMAKQATTSKSLAKFLELSPPHPNALAPYLDGPVDLGATLLYQCRSSSILTKEHTKDWNSTTRAGQTENCTACQQGTPETITHLLTQCPAYHTARLDLNHSIASLLTPEQMGVFTSLTASDRACMLLSDTWLGGHAKGLHCLVKQFLFRAWETRRKLAHPTSTVLPTDPSGLPSQGHIVGRAQTLAAPSTRNTHESASTTRHATPPHPTRTSSDNRRNTQVLQAPQSGEAQVQTNAHEGEPNLGSTHHVDTDTPIVLGAQPHQNGLTSGDRPSHGRVANGSDAKA